MMGLRLRTFHVDLLILELFDGRLQCVYVRGGRMRGQ